MDECLSTQYKLTCRRILEFLRSELSLAGCVIYHKDNEGGSVEFIVGNVPRIVEGKSNTSLDSISHLVCSGQCNSIVPDISQSLYPEHKVFHELNPVAIVAIPLTNTDDSQQSIIAGVSFRESQLDLSRQRTLLEFCADQLNQARQSLQQSLDYIQTIEMLTEEAYQDSMTGLYNRNGWELAIASAMADGFSQSACASVFVVDVNNLKALNDTQGHAAGDAVIRQVATVLKHYFNSKAMSEHARSESFVARTGGDEYMGLLFDCDDEVAASVSLNISEELLSLGVSVSVGFASCRNSRKLADAILNADEAMYLQKAQINNEQTGEAAKLKLTG